MTVSVTPAPQSQHVPWSVGCAIAAVLSSELQSLEHFEVDWSEPAYTEYLLKCLKVLLWCNESGFPVDECDGSHRVLFEKYLGANWCSLLPPAPAPVVLTESR